MVTSEPTATEAMVIFTCGNESYAVRDLLDSALIRGDLASAWQELVRLVACEKQAVGLDLKADEPAIDAATQAFRYKHDLITAEETEQWLEGWAIELGDFIDYFVRGYWGRTAPITGLRVLHESVIAEPIDYLSAPADMRELFRVHLILSGELTSIATRSSWRAAGHRSAGSGNISAQLIEAEEERFFQREGLSKSTLAGWLDRVGRDAQWFEKQMSVEAVFRQQVEALLTPRTRQRELAALRLPLTRFDTEIIEFDSREAAREAFLCARDDGISMAEIAAEGRYPYRNLQLVLENIDDNLQQKFLSLSPGSLLEPIARGDGFQVCKITGKHEPDGEDPAVRRRVKRRILARHFSGLAAAHIIWHITLNPTE
jgi:hypothetical protein